MLHTYYNIILYLNNWRFIKSETKLLLKCKLLPKILNICWKNTTLAAYTKKRIQISYSARIFLSLIAYCSVELSWVCHIEPPPMNEGSRTGPTYLIKVVLGAKKSKEKFQEICHFEVKQSFKLAVLDARFTELENSLFPLVLK